MNAAARSLEVLTAPSSLPWTDWAAQANADYLGNTLPQALVGLPADSAQGLVNMPEVISVLQRHLPADAVLTNGAGNFASWVHRYCKHHGLSKGFKTQLAPTVGAMGYGVPAGIAAAVLTGRVVFTIAGDGDFLMNGQELATATQHGAKSIVVLLNNGMYGTIRMHQERDFPTHNMGSHLNNPNFAHARSRSHHNSCHIVCHHAKCIEDEVSCYQAKKSRGDPAFFIRATLNYFKCLPIKPANSNMVTCALPKMAFNLSSALMLRLLTLSCRPCFLM
jgi:thiamine pyrophosphate-dependent acetolactate synthase large subunit-like protein